MKNDLIMDDAKNQIFRERLKELLGIKAASHANIATARDKALKELNRGDLQDRIYAAYKELKGSQ